MEKNTNCNMFFSCRGTALLPLILEALVYQREFDIKTLPRHFVTKCDSQCQKA